MTGRETPPLRGHPPSSRKRWRFTAVFDHAAGGATRIAGRPLVFSLALGVVLAWLLSGPLFGYSETWQLLINTLTTVVTFLMVFVIQHSQNKDSIALHLKLNELLAAQREASNSLIAVEDLDEDELQLVRRFYGRLAQLDREQGGVHHSHANHRIAHAHARKQDGRRAHGSARNEHRNRQRGAGAGAAHALAEAAHRTHR
ncbi:MAG TPA: low affinity iron permease family protein [Solimonas sp.]|nr:low affinity iron permease family protein [Solimonas sp.]